MKTTAADFKDKMAHFFAQAAKGEVITIEHNHYKTMQFTLSRKQEESEK